MKPLFLSVAFVLSATLGSSASPVVDDCATFRSWFERQPGSQLVVSATNAFNQQFSNPRRRDNLLDYSPTPFSNDRTSWYKAMRHFHTDVGNGRCFSAFYDPIRKTALVLSEYGTGSDLTVTTVSSAPAGLPRIAAPSQTQNGIRFGMTLAQVRAIDGSGSLRADGKYQRLMYSQNIKKTANFTITNYLGFLFAGSKLVAIDVGGGV